jgi:hypothetical protein
MSAAERALERQAARLQETIVRRQKAVAEAQATAFYRGNGQYSTLGAAGSYRPRGTVTSGGVPIGQSVPANGGLVGGMPAGVNGDPAAIVQTNERLATVAQERGPQLGDGNPNDTEATPRYPQDHYYNFTTGNLWQWQGATETEAGTWILLSGVLEQIDVPIDAPEDRTYLITHYQSYPCKIEAFHQPALAYTVTLAPAAGEVVAVGGSITLTLSDVPEDAPAVAFSIATRRI